MRRLDLALPLAFCVALPLLLPANAGAHGRYPEGGSIAFHPSDPNLILLRTTFGFLRSEDDGASFQWICPTVTAARWTEDPAITIANDGTLVVAVFDGLSTSATGCTWDMPSEDLRGEVIIDVDRAGDASALFALTSSGGVDNGVYRSIDDGATWEPTNPAIDPILFETIRVAPSDPTRLYLTGAYPPTAETPRRPFVYRSIDGGVGWDSVPFDDFRDGDRNIYLLGVDPSNADRALIRVRAEAGDRIYETIDGGLTFAEFFTVQTVDAFAWSADGQDIYIGSQTAKGLFHSADGSADFAQVRDDIAISCLGLRGDALFVCADNYADGYALGRSSDGGATITPLLNFADVGDMVTCGDGDDTTLICEPELDDLAADLGFAVDGGVPAPDSGISPDSGALPDGGVAPDGGTDGGEAPPGDGGGCTAGGPIAPAEGPSWAPALIFAALFLTRRRQRPGNPRAKC